MNEYRIRSDSRGRVPTKEAKEVYAKQFKPEYSQKPSGVKVKGYLSSYVKKDGTRSMYYKLKKGSRLVKNGEFVLYKNRCVARLSEQHSPKSGDKEQRRLYVVLPAKDISQLELEHLTSQIAYKLRSNFRGGGSWGDESCTGTIDKITNKVLVQYWWQTGGKKVWRKYAFEADIRKVKDGEYEVTNQRSLDDKSDAVSRENNITGVYQV